MATTREATRLDQVRTAFARAAAEFAERGVVAQRAADELLDRLQVIRRQPEVILDIGAGTGRMTRALSERYPQANVIALDASPEMLRRWSSVESSRGRPDGDSLWTRLASVVSGSRTEAPDSTPRRVLGDATRLPIADASVDFVVSNLTLTCCDPEQFMMEVARVLRPGGVIMFTTLGPDTLKELSEAWGQVGEGARVAPFIDMHDLGDIMVRAGLADPVVDMEMLTLTHRHVADLWADLRGGGSHNLHPDRPRTLTGRRTFERLVQTLETGRDSAGLLRTTVELVHGHAFAPDPVPDDSSGSGKTTLEVHFQPQKTPD